VNNAVALTGILKPLIIFDFDPSARRGDKHLFCFILIFNIALCLINPVSVGRSYRRLAAGLSCKVSRHPVQFLPVVDICLTMGSMGLRAHDSVSYRAIAAREGSLDI